MSLSIDAAFACYNTPYAPTDEEGDFLYKLYLLLFDQAPAKQYSWQKKRTLEAATESAATNSSWKIVCISEDALRHLYKERTAKGLQRAHPVDRAHRARHLFERAEALIQTDFLRDLFLYDTVALVPKKINQKHGAGHWPKLYPVPPGRLLAGANFSAKAKPEDIKWAEEMLSEIEVETPCHS